MLSDSVRLHSCYSSCKVSATFYSTRPFSPSWNRSGENLKVRQFLPAAKFLIWVHRAKKSIEPIYVEVDELSYAQPPPQKKPNCHCVFVWIFSVLLFNVGPKSFKNVSYICQKSVRKLSFTKICQKTIWIVSDICQKSVRFKYLS